MNPVADVAARRRTRRRIISSPLITLGLIALVFLFGRAAWGMFTKAEQARAAKIEAEEKLARVEMSRDALSKEAAALRTSTGLEGELRARFSVAKAGEEAVVIIEEPQQPAAAAAAPGFFGRLWASVAGWF
jgi:cell division protein FtsB